MRILPWLAKLSFAAFAAACLVGLVSALGTRLGAWDVITGMFVLFPWSLALGAFSFLVGILWVVWALVANHGEASRWGLAGLIGAALLLARPVYDIALAETLPAIHDVSTDLENPPRFIVLSRSRIGAGADKNLTPDTFDGSRLAVGPDGQHGTTASLQRKYYPDIIPRADLTPPDAFFQRAVKAAYGMGWYVVAVVPREGRIEATNTGLWFGLQNDIVIRVRPAGIGARLDIRAKSRQDLSAGPFGATDMGRNAHLIRDFLKTLSSTY